MNISITILWLVFTLIFIILGRFSWSESKKVIAPFKLTKRKYSEKGSQFQVQIDSAGTPLDKPLEDFASDFNAYLAEQNLASASASRNAAFATYAAALTSLLSAFVEAKDILAPLIMGS